MHHNASFKAGHCTNFQLSDSKQPYSRPGGWEGEQPSILGDKTARDRARSMKSAWMVSNPPSRYLATFKDAHAYYENQWEEDPSLKTDPVCGVFTENCYTGVSEASKREAKRFMARVRAKPVRQRPAADPARSGAKNWQSEAIAEQKGNVWSKDTQMQQSFNPHVRSGFRPDKIWDHYEQEWVERERYFRIKHLRTTMHGTEETLNNGVDESMVDHVADPLANVGHALGLPPSLRGTARDPMTSARGTARGTTRRDSARGIAYTGTARYRLGSSRSTSRPNNTFATESANTHRDELEQMKQMLTARQTARGDR